MILSDCLNSALQRSASTLFFSNRTGTQAPFCSWASCVWRCRGHQHMYKKGSGLTHLQPSPWQNTSACLDWFPEGECSSCWQWVVVMSWAFPCWAPLGASLVPEGLGWARLLQSHVGDSAGVGTGALTLLYVLAQERCQLWNAMGQHFQAANAESSSSCSNVSLGCYLLALKTRFLLQVH